MCYKWPGVAMVTKALPSKRRGGVVPGAPCGLAPLSLSRGWAAISEASPVGERHARAALGWTGQLPP